MSDNLSCLQQRHFILFYVHIVHIVFYVIFTNCIL